MGVTDVAPDLHDVAPTSVPCPACGRAFVWPPTGRCVQCGADLPGPVAAAIFDLDREADALRRRRRSRVQELRAGASIPALVDLPPPVAATAIEARRPSEPLRRSSLRPQTLLAAAGAVLLLAAVIVFIAVTWPTWPASAQVAFVAGLTVVGALAARMAAARQLPTTADAIGVLTLAVAGYSLLAAHAEGVAGLDRVDAALWVAVAGAVIAVVAPPFTAWATLRAGPRRFALVAAVVASGGLMAWLADVVPAEPPLVLLAVAPTIAIVLLAHGRWSLAPGDWARHLVPVVPAALLAATAMGTGSLDLTSGSAAAAGLAAVVGLPLLVWARWQRGDNAWSYPAAVLAVLWVAQLATLYLTGATVGALGLAMPQLVTFTVAATTVLGVARLAPASEHWHDPVLVAAGLAAIPAAAWTVSVAAVQAAVVADALWVPFTGWPPAEALDATDLVLAVAALVVGLALVERVGRTPVRPVAVAAAGSLLLVAVVAGAAAGALPAAAPLALTVMAAGGAAVWWHRDPTRWPVVIVTHTTALVLAVVELDLFSLTTAAVAAHLLWVAARRDEPITAAGGVASGLAAVAAATQALDWTVPTTTLSVTVLAGAVLVWAQLVPHADTWRHTATDGVVALSAVVATAAAAAVDEPTMVAVQLAVVAVVAAVHAARPHRGWAAWVSALAASCAVWVLLGDRGVDVVEAYTLPSALALAVAGAWRLHSTTTGSWPALSPACVTASLPTLVVLLDGPDPTRVLLLAGGAVAVALAGHWRRLAAPLAFGTVVAMITAVLQLHYWTAHLPRWVTFAVLGGVLIWASATYEAQRRRSRHVREHLHRLR